MNENQVICLEDLNIKGMLRNRHLSKAVADSGLFELRRQLEYKAKWYGRDVFIVDRFAPTSKTCSECGSYQPEMPLKIREWTCPDCDTHHDRDINAAKNILNFSTAGSAGTYKARGAVKTPRAAA
jgi:putative transposase